MEKKNKIVLISIIIITVLVLGGCVYSVITNKNEVNSDAVKFMNEYTELNGKINEYNGATYVNVELPESNTFKYATEEKAIELLKEKSGVIYFGFSTCPWCRSLVSTLGRVAKEENETIYYLDILNIRSSFEVKDGKLNKLKEGSKGYYELLELLDEELESFVLEDEEANKFDTGEKRLYAPTLVAFNQGKITSVHVGTVESQISGYDELTDDQIKELEDIILALINSKNEKKVCTKDKC